MMKASEAQIELYKILLKCAHRLGLFLTLFNLKIILLPSWKIVCIILSMCSSVQACHLKSGLSEGGGIPPNSCDCSIRAAL